MPVESVDSQAVRKALDIIEWPDTDISISDITEIEHGVNDVYTFSTGLEDPKRAVCKFGTFSQPIAFQAGVSATRLIAEYTAIPVPDVYAIRANPTGLPAFQITEFLPGEPLTSHPEPDDLGPARAFGRVIGQLGTIPSEMTDGYGWIQPNSVDDPETVLNGSLSVDGEYDTCSEWLLQYGLELYEELPAHETLAATAQAVPSFLQEHSHLFPDDPSPSIVLNDFGPGNLLAPDGTVSATGSLTEVTGLIDVERARLGPMEFNAVNAEFLMQRWIDEPEPAITALYEPLPFGPDVPRRDLYRLLAMGREVGALDMFYEVGSETHEQRGTKLAREIEQILEERHQ
jgi:aminoglycoside phosphotransferase (APT) family kinase protein